ncbi:MAG: agmatinase [Actinobacteria bacterium]|nr:agmatinase [Actinomycetota bacterium]
MTRIGNMYGPDFTFLGVQKCDLEKPETFKGADVVIVGAPIDSGTSHRSGAKFGPQAIRMGDYLPHDGSRPHLALRVDPLQKLKVVDAGDLLMPGSDLVGALKVLQTATATIAKSGAVPVVLGGDHSIASADVAGIADHLGKGKVSMIHFDAHADTGEDQFGTLVGHGTPMRRLIEDGYVRGDRFLQLGLRGYWPDAATLNWMAKQKMRSYEMTEIHSRGMSAVLDESFKTLTDGCTGVFLSVDIDVVDPGMAPGTGTPEPGGMTSRELLEAVRRICFELPIVGIDVVEVAPAYDQSEITAVLANRVVLEALSAIALKKSGGSFNPTKNLLADR